MLKKICRDKEIGQKLIQLLMAPLFKVLQKYNSRVKYFLIQHVLLIF